MRAQRFLRVPLQIGTSSLTSLVRASAFVVPGMILLAAPLVAMFYFDSEFGDATVYLFFPGSFVFLFAWKHLKRARAERPSDLLLTGAGFEVRFGPHSGTSVSWFELVRVTMERPRKGPDKETDESDLRQLCVYLRNHHRVVLGAADQQVERKSLTKLAWTLQAGCGERQERTPRAPATGDAVKLVTCPGCGAAVAPADAASVSCAFCSKAAPIPEAVRQRLRDAADLARRPDAAVARLLDQPGAGWVGALLAFGALFMLAAWPAALAAAARSYYRHEQSWAGSGFLLLFVASCILGFFGLVRGRLVDRQALRLVALDFGAVPPASPGKPSLCRRCLAPLPEKDRAQVLISCVYCGSENVLGIDLRRDADAAREESRSLADALARRASERRRWRGVSVAALALIALSAWSLRHGVGPAPVAAGSGMHSRAEDLAACSQGDQEACARAAHPPR